MDHGQEEPANPLLSQAATLAGNDSAFQAKNQGPAVPDFPVKDWDRYECLGFLGQGGMGMVFLARDRRLGREVAIKFVRVEDARHVERFMLEARAQARVDHDHVCRVFEVGEIEGRVFITMQHIAGASLEAAAPELSLEQVVVVLRDAARGVHEAHRMGIIHRDLKPSNLMVERAEDGALKTFVMDFGLAHEWNQDLTETGSVLGTPAYMSPEQARGEVSTLDRRADVYGLGATLYHLLAGRPPIPGNNPLEVLSAIATEDVRSLRSLGLDLPRDLEAITLKCLEKERTNRYESAKAFADDLDRFLAGEPVRARPTGFWYLVQRRLRKHRQLAIASAVALALVLVALGAALKTRLDAGRRERLAQQFTEAMGRIDSMARYSALAPLHDIRADLQDIQARMGRLQADMQRAGAIANGPGHYALGRGYWTLDDAEKAREHLQMAWDAGFQEPRVAYALALVLGHQYQETLLEAERIPSSDQREIRKRDVEERLRIPALSYLRRARGTDAPSPAYLEALLASYEGRGDEAIDRIREVESGLPWFYEAPLLRGSLLQARAWKRWNQGDPDGAQADFEAGRKALLMAAAAGRSAPSVHAALAELELNALIMEKYGRGAVEPAFQRGMAAVGAALAAQADHVPSLILQSTLLGNLADFRTSRGEDALDLVQRAVASAKDAVAAGSTRADAWTALGMAYYQWGNARQDRDLDPREQLALGLQALESLSPEKRDYRVENHLGLIHQTWADYQDQHGEDPSGHLNGAIAAFEQATRVEPHLLPAWINLGTCLEQRAALPRAEHPETDLQAALKALDQAQALNPRHFVPHFVRGKVLYSLALRKRDRGADPEPDLRRSLEVEREGIAINPEVPHLYNALGMTGLELARQAWEAGHDPWPRLAEAQSAFRKAIAIAPNQIFGHLNLADLLLQKARWEPGTGAAHSLDEAERILVASLKRFPGNRDLLANLGRVQAVRTEGGNPGPGSADGEAVLARALAVDANHRDTWRYLGELRGAVAALRIQQGRAKRRDFEGAEAAFRKALAVDPDALEIQLDLVRLYLARAQWEARTGSDPATSLANGRVLLAGLLKARPAWSEAQALFGDLLLQEAEHLPAGERGLRAMEALQRFIQAFSRNPHLTRQWHLEKGRAQRLQEGAS